MKKVLSVLCTLSLTLSMFSTSLASDIQTNRTDYQSLIENYFEAIGNKDFELLASLSHESIRDYISLIYGNEVNMENNIGLFNIKQIELLDSMQISREQVAYSFDPTLYEIYPTLSVFYVTVDVDLNEEDDLLKEGSCTVLILTAEENGRSYILDMVSPNDDCIDIIENDVSPNAIDSPVYRGALQTPPTINVLRLQRNSGEPSSVVGSIQTVDFKEYCYNVTMNEFGTNSNELEAVRAVALAIKNFAYHRTIYNRSISKNFDLIDIPEDPNGDYFGAQYYNPMKTPTARVKQAVNYIWDYYIYDSEYGLLLTRHYRGNTSGGKNSGQLHQLGANSLAEDGYNFKEILHYYYDKVNNNYITSGVANGAINIHEHDLIITITTAKQHKLWCKECDHTNAYDHIFVNGVCTVCGDRQ